MMKLERLTQASDARDLPLIEGEPAAFSVLHKILAQPCEKIVTDHARLILCHSARPYPVWVFTAADADAAELERAWQVVRAEFPPEAGFSYNVRDALAEIAMREGLRATMRLNAYACAQAVEPARKPKGYFGAAMMSEAALCARWIGRFREECGLGQADLAKDREEAERIIGARRFFLWRDAQGVPCAMCGVRQDGRDATLTHVYTDPDRRRQGYAASLTYGVTHAILAQQMRAMLYADADYAPSNACYRGIGYRLEGTICTVQR